MLFQRFPATRLSWTARLVLIAAAALALPASPRPLSSQESGDDALAADEPVIEARAPGVAVQGEETRVTRPTASPDTPTIAPVTPVRASNAVAVPAAGAPVIVAGPYERGLVAVGAAPAGAEANDVEQRLKRVEDRIDALLRELQLIRSQMSPGAAGARSPRAATSPAPVKARTSSVRTGTRGATSGYGASSSDASIRATSALGGGRASAASGVGAAPAGAAAPGATPAPTGGMPNAAPSADPAGDWLSPPPDDLTEEQRARVEELDRQYRERLLKHKARYAREREEAIRRIREGKDPNTVEESLQTR